MQDHRFSFEIDATPQEIWRVFWGKKTGDVIEHGDVRIEILHGGDSTGEGLIRHCYFRVPLAQSWEWLTEVKPNESWRYDAVGKPLWSRASGWTRLEDLGDGRTRVHFRETYEVFNPILRLLLEKRVHHYISGDNDKIIKTSIEKGIELMRSRDAKAMAG
jgi:hypothetical protein